jgi:hypothetical protein
MPSCRKIYEVLGTKRELVEGKYFRIIDIKSYYNQAEYNLEKLPKFGYSPIEILLSFKIINEDSGDTLEWDKLSTKLDNAEFLLVPFFDKMKKIYEGSSLVAKSDLSDLIDINTGKNVNINRGDIWKCQELTLLELERVQYCSPYYILRNEKGENIKMELYNLKYYFSLVETCTFDISKLYAVWQFYLLKTDMDNSETKAETNLSKNKFTKDGNFYNASKETNGMLTYTSKYSIIGNNIVQSNGIQRKIIELTNEKLVLQSEISGENGTVKLFIYYKKIK